MKDKLVQSLQILLGKLAYVLATGRKSRVELDVTENVQTGQEHCLDRLFEIVVRKGERPVEALLQEEAELHSKYVPVEICHLWLEIHLFSCFQILF